MRVGNCPSRVKRDFINPPRVTVCVVVHIPNQLDYYAHKLDVLKLSLASLRANTPRDLYGLIVLDNASCPAAIDYLRALNDAGDIDQLILSSRNIGKINASRMLFEAAPGEVVAYADDDVWYGPRWLEAQLEILDGYPRVGLVSGRPVRKQFAYGNAYLPGYLAEFPEITSRSGHIIPEEWEREYLRSIGREHPDSVAGVAARHTDILLEYRGLQAYSTAAHFQFIAPKPVILAALNKRDQPRTGSEERQFEEALDTMGYARLSTAGCHVRHIGNMIVDDLRDEAVRYGLSVPPAAVWRARPNAWLRVIRRRPVRSLLQQLNRWSYLLLNHP